MSNRIRQKFVNSFKFVVSPSKAIYNIPSLLIRLADKLLFIDKVIYESPRFDSTAYPSLCVFGQLTRKSFSVARVKAV